MSQETLNKVWSVVAVTLVYLSLNAWSFSQQWKMTLPGNPFKEDGFTSYGVTLAAIPIGAALIIVTSLLTVLYARRTKAKHWAARFPRFSNLHLSPATFDGRLAQGCSVCVFLALPVAAQIHFMGKFLDGTAYRGALKLWSGSEHLRHFVPLGDALSGEYTYDRLGPIAPTFVPFWQPWCFVLIDAIVLATVCGCVIAVFVPNRVKWLAESKTRR